MEKNLELLPCPLCGRRADLIRRIGGWTVSCHYGSPLNAALDNVFWCSKSPITEMATKSKAIDLWNKRIYHFD